MKPPCYNCPDREIGCHGKCERYREYKAQVDVIREKRRYNAEAVDTATRSYYRRKPYKANKLGGHK